MQMAKLGHEMSPYNAVFIDTSLDTHFATVVSFSDTVSDLKRKIIHEHSLCFPHIGDIKILALKVKRRGCLYHLSDSVLVGSIFRSVNKIWFIKADAIIEKENNDCSGRIVNGVNLLLDARPEMLLTDVVDNRNAPVADEQLNLDVAGEEVLKNSEIGVECDGDNTKGVSLDANGNVRDKGNEVERTPVGVEEINSRSELGDNQGNARQEAVLETGSRTNKKHKSKTKSKHVSQLALNQDISVPEAAKHESRQEIVGSVVPQGDVLEDENLIGGTSNEAQGMEAVSGLPGKHVELRSDKSRRSGVDAHSKLERKAKKKRKFDELRKDDEYLLKRDESLVVDSSKETIEPSPISQQSPEEKKTNENPTLGSSVTETLDDVHLQSADLCSGKRKKKKKSNSKYGEQELHGGASSEPGAVSLKEKRGDPIQEVNVRPPSQETDMGNSDADNVKGRQDGSRAIASDTRSMKVSDDSTAIHVGVSSHHGVQESDNIKKMIEVSRDKNSVLGDYQNLGADRANLAVGQQNLVPNLSSKTLPSENYEPAALDVLAPKTIAAVTSKLLEARETLDHPKSSKKSKRPKKTKELGSEIPSKSVTEHVEGFVSVTSIKPLTEANGDQTNDNSNEDESNVSPKEEKEVSEMRSSASLLATEKEIDDVIQNALQSVQQIGQGEFSAENMDGKSRKKSKKKRTLDAKDLQGMENENQKVSAPSADVTTTEVEHSSNGPTHRQSSYGQPHETENNIEGRCPEAVVDGNACKSSHINEGCGNLEVSCGNSGINFNDCFMPNQDGDIIVGSDKLHVDRAAKPMKVDGETKANKNKKKRSAHSHGPSPDSESSHGLTRKHRIGAAPLNVYDSGAKIPPFSKSEELDSGPEKPRISNAVNPSATSTYGKNKRAASNSSLESSKGTSFLNRRVNSPQPSKDHDRMNNRKISTINNTGEIVNGSQHKEIMMGASDSIFKDVADEVTSTEEDNSDSSTRTPSDKSLYSDYSDGESNADFKSSQNGADNWRRKDGGRKSIRKPLSSSGMTLDSILRSSSRYKKAKLTASQSQLEDTEGQPAEFVPDSQANS